MKCIEDEIPFELPEGWAWSRFLSAFIINPRNNLPDDTEVSFVPMSLIQEGYANNHACEIKTWKKVKSGFTHFAENDIGVAKITPCFENKKSVVFNDLRNGFGAGTTELHIIRTVGNAIYPEYVLWNIKTDAFVSNGVNAFSGAVGQKRIGKDFIEKSLMPIAPTSEQKRIVERISMAFECIDKIDASIETFNLDINAVKRNILDLAVRGKLVPQDPADEPASVLLERIIAEKEELIKQGKIKRDKKESIIFKGEDNSYYEKIGDSITDITDETPFELPKYCVFVRFKDILNLLSGRDLAPCDYNDQGHGVPYITGASNFFSGSVVISRWTDTPQVITQLGDLLITCKGTVGEIAFNAIGDAHIARQIMAIRNVYNLNMEYLSLCISFYIEALKTSAKGLIPGISRDDILNLILPLPSEKYQSRVVIRVNELLEIIDSIEKSLN